MFYNNYRFHFANDVQFHDPKKSTESIERILNEAKSLGVERVAVDLTSQDKSISLLCTSKDDIAIKAKITQLLLAEGIALSEMMEIEALEDEEEIAHESHAHDHGHSDAHDHAHSDAHDHYDSPAHDHAHSDAHGHGHSHYHDNHWLKAALGLVWGAGLLVLSIASLNIPIIAYYVITGLTTLMTLYLGRTVYQSAWQALLEKRWDTTTLYTISTLTIVVVSIISMFVPGLPMIFEAAPFILGFWHLGEGIEHTLIDEINNKLDVRDCVPPLVLLKGKPDKEISVKKLIQNDIIIVNKGSVIPVDGVLTKKALLYTTRIDGSPDLTEFKPGDVVKAGMRLADHIPSLEMRVTKTYQNSYLSLIAKNIKKANEEKAPVEIFANTVLKYFIPGLIAVALISGIVIGSLFSPGPAILSVVSVLVSACPCALRVITPLAVKIGMQKASENGIHYNNGKALQAAADIDDIVFDLNGTLTKGTVAIDAFQIADNKLLGHIALLESQSDHPVAKIIKSFIEDQVVVASESLEIASVDKSHHSGIKGLINGELFLVGNRDMLLANGISHIDEPYDKPENGSVYIVRGTTVIGQIALTDPLREDALTTVNQLKNLGKTVHICTGSDRAYAEKYAALLGISKDNICANAVGVVTKPGEVTKTNYLEKLKGNGRKVAMVGDAINDVPAIAYADVGIAVKSNIGDEITYQHAGIVVQKRLLFPIVTAFDVADKTKQNIFQNLFVSLTYNSTITLVASGLFVALNPVIGVALMVLESTIVLANLYRFKHQIVATASSIGKKAVIDEDDIEHTTSKVLDALGYRTQPKPSLASVSESREVNPKARNLFASKENLSPLSQWHLSREAQTPMG